MSRVSDTSPEAQKVLTEAYRSMPPSRRLALIGEQYRLARTLHAAGVRRRRPSATQAEIDHSWREQMLGPGSSPGSHGDDLMDADRNPLEILREIAAALESLGIRYAVGGSWASSYYGEARMTRDADLAVDPFPGRESEFVASFGPEYYLSVDAARTANRERSTFNVIHSPTGFKVDLFVRKDEPFERSLLDRRTVEDTGLAWIAPEDIVLLKLRWFRMGGETSDRQWTDILGVLRVQAGVLHEDYLDHWAAVLGLSDLLARARAEVV